MNVDVRQPSTPGWLHTTTTSDNNNTTTTLSDNYTVSEDYTASTSEQYSVAERALIGLVLSLIIVVAVCGNTLVIVAILTDRNLRKTSNYFIVSLAVADTLVALLVMTFAVVQDVLARWVFGAVFCNIWISFDVMCSTASILNLCAISLDRYIHIRSPLHYDRRMTARRTLAAILTLWMLSALISFLPIQLGWHRLHSSSPAPESRDVTARPPAPHYECLLALNPLYAVISSVVSFYAPCFVMVFIYIKLYQYARMHVKNIKRTWAAGGGGVYCAAGRGSDETGSPGVAGEGGVGRAQYKLQDHKAAITLGVIMGTFLLCWLPFFTINIVGAFKSRAIPPLVFTIFTWLGYLNSTMNPVIYSIFNVEFREAFKRVLHLKKCPLIIHSPHCRRQFDQFKTAPGGGRTNGRSTSIEYGAVNSSRDRLMSNKITSV